MGMCGWCFGDVAGDAGRYTLAHTSPSFFATDLMSEENTFQVADFDGNGLVSELARSPNFLRQPHAEISVLFCPERSSNASAAAAWPCAATSQQRRWLGQRWSRLLGCSSFIFCAVPGSMHLPKVFRAVDEALVGEAWSSSSVSSQFSWVLQGVG